MDASTNLLADNVRAKRNAIDNDLELLRIRLSKADPRRMDTTILTHRVLPAVAGAAAVWLFSRRRRRVASLEHLLLHALTELYRAELTVLPALKSMSLQAHNEDLKQEFARHGLETEGQVNRLERVFRSVGAKAKTGSSPTAAAIAADGQRLLSRKMNRNVRDAWLIATAQRVEHLEIAGYGTARTYAETLGYTFAAQLLEQTLEEEKAADERLTTLAERYVNPRSARVER